MGLLGSSWDDPKSQGLLALAAGMMQGNMGKGVADMSSTMAGAQDQAMKRKLMQMQFDEAAQGLEQKRLSMSNMRDGLAMLNQKAAPAQTGQLGSGSFGAMPTASGQPDVPQLRPASDVVASWSPSQVLTYERLTGQKVADVWKAANEGFKREAGAVYRLPGGGTEFGPPAVDKNIQLFGTPGGGYRVAPVDGAVDSISALEGARSDAVESSKARHDPYTFTPKGATNPVTTTRQNFLQPEQRGVVGKGYNGGTRDGANAESIRMMQNELLKPGLSSEDSSGIKREIEVLRRQSGFSAGVEVQSPSEAATLLDQAKADVQPTQQKQASIDSARNAYDLVTKVLNHPGIGQATGLSGTVNPANYIPGTDAKNFNVLAKQLKGNVFLSAYAQLKGSGSITEIEGGKAEQAIARMDQSQSTAEYKQALKDYQSIMAQGLKRMGVNPESQWGSGNSGVTNPESSGLSINAPNGKTYTFKSEQEMKNFKMSTGLK